MSKITKPSAELDIKIQEQAFKIKYPNSGQMIDIATLKAKLSDGQYTQLLVQRSAESGISLKLIDAYCFFSIMAPTMRDHLNVKSLYDLEIFDSVELIHVHENEIIPWMEQWIQVINNRIEELENKNDTNGKRSLV